MNTVRFDEVVVSPYRDNALIRNDFPGFKEDYWVLHCLIKKYQPNTFMEIGTSVGNGTKIICQAMMGRKVYSIDLPPGTDPNEIYPNHEDGLPEKAGACCDLPYTQLFGDSNQVDLSSYYPLDGWFIDGKHAYGYVAKDTETALRSNPRIIIWHDADIQEVWDAIVAVLQGYPNYLLFRVEGTRIAYAAEQNSLND